MCVDIVDMDDIRSADVFMSLTEQPLWSYHLDGAAMMDNCKGVYTDDNLARRHESDRSHE